MELAQQKLTQQTQAQQTQPQQSDNSQKALTSSGRGTIDKILKPSPLRFLPCVKKEKEEEEDDKVVITGVTETAQPRRYIPKVVPGVENLVPMEVQNLKNREEGAQKVHQSPKVDKIQNIIIVIVAIAIIIDLMNW